MEHEEILKRLKLMLPIPDDEIISWEVFGEKEILIELSSGFKFIFQVIDHNNWSIKKYDGVIQGGGYK